MFALKVKSKVRGWGSVGAKLRARAQAARRPVKTPGQIQAEKEAVSINLVIANLRQAEKLLKEAQGKFVNADAKALAGQLAEVSGLLAQKASQVGLGQSWASSRISSGKSGVLKVDLSGKRINM